MGLAGPMGKRGVLWFLMVCLGGLVVMRAARSDVTLAFLGAYLALVFGRSLWLGEPMAIPLHRLQNGALLLFAFFMISDPRTTPDSRLGRILFATLVALWRVVRAVPPLPRPTDCSGPSRSSRSRPPVIDWLRPGAPYRWASPKPDRLTEEYPSSNPQTALP